jgi:hypothetical protein
MTLFYLASRFSRRHELQGYRADLARIGHTVTSRWIDQEQDEVGEAAAKRDIDDIDIADELILFSEQPRCPTRGGRWFEAGYAVAQGKPVIIVGPLENIFCNLSEIKKFVGWPAAIQVIGHGTTWR